jgi:hypothetical protein
MTRPRRLLLLLAASEALYIALLRLRELKES